MGGTFSTRLDGAPKLEVWNILTIWSCFLLRPGRGQVGACWGWRGGGGKADDRPRLCDRTGDRPGCRRWDWGRHSCCLMTGSSGIVAILVADWLFFFFFLDFTLTGICTCWSPGLPRLHSMLSVACPSLQLILMDASFPDLQRWMNSTKEAWTKPF